MTNKEQKTAELKKQYNEMGRLVDELSKNQPYIYELVANYDLLNEWECNFVDGIMMFDFMTLSEKQKVIVCRIGLKVCALRKKLGRDK